MSINLYEKYGTNKDLEQDGVFLNFGEPETGPMFKVRRAGGSNTKFKAVFNQKMRPFSRAIANGTLGEDKSNSLLHEIFFESVVVGWKNINGRDGNPLEYNKANFVQLMSDLPELWGTLREEASDIRNFQDQATPEADGEALGN